MNKSWKEQHRIIICFGFKQDVVMWVFRLLDLSVSFGLNHDSPQGLNPVAEVW